MRYLGIGFHVIVAIYFAVHAVRTRQNIYWLLILFAFPMLGSVVYFFAIYLPNLRQSRDGGTGIVGVALFGSLLKPLERFAVALGRSPAARVHFPQLDFGLRQALQRRQMTKAERLRHIAPHA